VAAGISQAPSVYAATVQETLRGYEAEARKLDAAFKSSASRGEQFFRSERTNASGGALACFTCHTSDPRQAGVTRAHKPIEPLAPAANPARFTDAVKVEKWFGRNCEDVLERSCTAAEKADFIQWLLTIR
jgi:hypothetical protein